MASLHDSYDMTHCQSYWSRSLRPVPHGVSHATLGFERNLVDAFWRLDVAGGLKATTAAFPTARRGSPALQAFGSTPPVLTPKYHYPLIVSSYKFCDVIPIQKREASIIAAQFIITHRPPRAFRRVQINDSSWARIIFLLG